MEDEDVHVKDLVVAEERKEHSGFESERESLTSSVAHNEKNEMSELQVKINIPLPNMIDDPDVTQDDQEVKVVPFDTEEK